MALYPKAVLKLLPENKTQPRIDPDQAILHSAVDAPGPTSLYGYFSRADVTVESHFFVRNDGTVEQYMDTNVRADANYKANGRAISIETEDDGDPDRRPWSTAQVRAIIDLLDWICRTHPKVLRRQCPSWDAPGIGWHSMWGAPSPWTPVRGKTCPGTIRVPQAKEIIAAVASGSSTQEWDEMASKDEIRQLIKEEVADLPARVWGHKVHFVGDSRQPATLVVRDIAHHARAAAKVTDPKAVADMVLASMPKADARATAEAIIEALKEKL